MLLNLLYTSIELFFEYGDEKRIKEVLIDKKFLTKIIESLTQKSNSEEKDFAYCCKKLGKKLEDYAQGHKTKFARDILTMPS